MPKSKSLHDALHELEDLQESGHVDEHAYNTIAKRLKKIHDADGVKPHDAKRSMLLEMAAENMEALSFVTDEFQDEIREIGFIRDLMDVKRARYRTNIDRHNDRGWDASWEGKFFSFYLDDCCGRCAGKRVLCMLAKAPQIWPELLSFLQEWDITDDKLFGMCCTSTSDDENGRVEMVTLQPRLVGFATETVCENERRRLQQVAIRFADDDTMINPTFRMEAGLSPLDAGSDSDAEPEEPAAEEPAPEEPAPEPAVRRVRTHVEEKFEFVLTGPNRETLPVDIPRNPRPTGGTVTVSWRFD